MINNTALDVAIGLTLMYLMLGLLCTVVNEFIATWLNLRAKSLATALTQLLDDKDVRNAFYDHGLISGTKTTLEKVESLAQLIRRPVTVPMPTPSTATSTPATPAPIVASIKPTSAPPVIPAPPLAAPVPSAPADAPAASTKPGTHPSYLSADMFVQALIGGLSGTRLAQGQPAPTFADIKTAIEKLPESNIKSALLSSVVTANGEINAFRVSVAKWYDDSMERLSGAYKRNLKFISMLVGIAIAVGFNADTFRVVNTLWNDPALRDRVMLEAGNIAQSGTTSEPAIISCNIPPATVQTGSAAPQETAETAALAGGSTVPAAGHTNAIDLAKLKDAITNTQDCLRPFPIGWTAAFRAQWIVSRPLSWPWLSVLGWLVTALALSLGAPFWFDVLAKFINIRGVGPKPPRADARA